MPEQIIGGEVWVALVSAVAVITAAYLASRSAVRAPNVTRINALEKSVDDLRLGLGESQKREIACERRCADLEIQIKELSQRLADMGA